MRIAQVFSDHGCFSLQISVKNDANGGENISMHSFILPLLR